MITNCTYIQYGDFIYLYDSAVEIPEVNEAEMSLIDTYLRELYGDNGRVHVFGYYDASEDVNRILGQAIDWSGYNGISLYRIRWNFTSCAQDLNQDERVNLSLARSGFSPSTQFGLFVHEISHANGTLDGDGSEGDASWWERIGKLAYEGRCELLQDAASDHCRALNAIIYAATP